MLQGVCFVPSYISDLGGLLTVMFKILSENIGVYCNDSVYVLKFLSGHTCASTSRLGESLTTVHKHFPQLRCWKLKVLR